MSYPLLEIRSLYKCHETRTPVFCAGIDYLDLFPGDIVGITGPSGCGKSTLLEMLALLTCPSQAERFLLHVSGESYPLDQLARSAPQMLTTLRRTHMGFVHQAGGLYPFLTVRENVALPLRLTGQCDAASASRSEELLEFLGLRHLAARLPETLSYGERQRTAVARALVHRPRLILADEPTSALDPSAAQAVMSLLLEGAQQAGAALLIVSHDHDLLARTGVPGVAMEDHSCPDHGRIQYTLSLPPARESRTVTAAGTVLPPSRRRSVRNSALLFRLAWRDFFHERMLSLCAVLAFAAALTPLMVLGGLKTGVVGILSQRLLNNPAALAIHPYSSQRYTSADIAALRMLPSVRFVVPLTRTLASSVLVERNDKPPVAADILPTAPGDPLLERYATVPSAQGVVITRELARSLPEGTEGKTLTLLVTRRHEGQMQSVRCAVTVQAVLPDAADWKAHIYVPLPLLMAMERYRDGFAVPEQGWPGRPAGKTQPSFAGFRMYVDSLEAVIPIRDALKRRGIDAYTFAREVETIQSLKQAFTMITLLVGGVTLAGMAFSLGSLAVANVRRKARFFAQSCLMGLSRNELLLVPLLQMGFIALLAASCSLVLYGAAAALLDLAAAPWLEAGESACVLPLSQLVLLYTGSLVLACLCGMAACRHLLRLQPAEVLRRDE